VAKLYDFRLATVFDCDTSSQSTKRLYILKVWWEAWSPGPPVYAYDSK